MIAAHALLHRRRLAGLAVVTVLLGACSGDDGKAPAVAGTAADAASAAEPKEVQRVVYRCADGRELVLRLHDDQRARVDLDHLTHVLRPVPVDGGTLFLGDSINVRVAGQRATASRDGIVLMANCQAQLAAEPGVSP